ncbi:MAG: tetratricopeptide repeat protein [Verrucomicrobiota bacterium]|jgi:Flp pilus assembly protein TadD
MDEQSEPTVWRLWLSSWQGIGLLLALVTLVVWWPVVHCDFLSYDDPGYFTSNPHIQGGLTWANIDWAFTTEYSSNWHPLTWLSLMLDVDIFGTGPFGPHFTNLIFHTVNTVLLFLLLRRLTMANLRSALVAALFALHPLHVESVAWVAERKDVLCAFFGLLSLLAYARYVKGDNWPVTPAAAPPVAWYRSPFYWGALIFFVLGLMSKPMLVTLPLVMLLLDYWPLGRSSGFTVPGSGSAPPLQRFNASTLQRLLVEKIPFFLLSAASCVVTIIAQEKWGSIASLAVCTPPMRIENMLVSYVRYLGKTFWPVSLATPYPHPKFWPIPLVLVALVLLVFLCVVVIRLRKRFPYAFTGWFWFVIMLIPVIGLVQVGSQAMADRYTYLPLIGIFIVLSWGFAELQRARPMSGQKAGFLVAVGLAVCAGRTRNQISFWQNDGSLFFHTLKMTGDNYVAYINLGDWFSKNGQMEYALDCYHRASNMEPTDALVLYDLANGFARLGRWDEAISHYHLALRAAPAQPDVLDNLGLVLATTKHYAEAITNFEAALKLDPRSPNAHNNLAAVLFAQQHYDEAVQQYHEALRLTPDDPRIYMNLGITLARLNRASEARTNYLEALRLDPSNTVVATKLKALETQGPP